MTDTSDYLKSSEFLDRYLWYMGQIKIRIYHINLCLSDSRYPMGHDCIVDQIYIHIRKILELISFSVLSANFHYLDRKMPGAITEYHASKVMKSAERKFGNVYPSPVRDVNGEFMPVNPDLYLTRSEFDVLYGFCGDVLHTRNPFKKNKVSVTKEVILSHLNKIVNLLSVHKAHIAGTPNMYLVQMRSGHLSNPSIHIFTPTDEVCPVTPGYAP